MSHHIKTGSFKSSWIKSLSLLGCGLGCVLSLSTLSGCNTFGFMDSPSGDLSTLAAARACFDGGNYTCASTNYAKLSSAASDDGNSESAFLLLAQYGAGSAVFMNAVTSGGST